MFLVSEERRYCDLSSQMLKLWTGTLLGQEQHGGLFD